MKIFFSSQHIVLHSSLFQLICGLLQCWWLNCFTVINHVNLVAVYTFVVTIQLRSVLSTWWTKLFFQSAHFFPVVAHDGQSYAEHY